MSPKFRQAADAFVDKTATLSVRLREYTASTDLETSDSLAKAIADDLRIARESLHDAIKAVIIETLEERDRKKRKP